MKKGKEPMTIRETVINALASHFSFLIEESDIQEIEARIASYQAVKNRSGLAYIIARNWALSKMRKMEAARKQRAKELLAAEKKRHEREKIEAAKKEFWATAQQAIKSAGPKNQKASESLMILWQKHFEGKGDEELARIYSCARMLIYKRRERARCLLKPFASPRLWEYLIKDKYRQCQ